jgi:hypothetical protein
MPRSQAKGEGMKAGILVVAVALLLPPLAAEAQSYRCTSKDGRKHYGATIPPACAGQPVELLNSQGLVVKRVDPQGEEKARQEKKAAEAQKREQKAAQQEAARRNNALLATYTSPKDIDEARARALANNQKAVREIQTRIGQIKKRQADLELQKSKGKPPAGLDEDMQLVEVDLKSQQELLAVKQKEIEQINARFDDDKKRFAELTGKR